MLRYMAADFSIWSSDRSEVEILASYEAALADFRSIGDERRASWCLNGIGNAHILLGQFDAARIYHAENLALKPRDAPDFDVAIGLSNLAQDDFYLGNLEAARAGWEEARRLLEQSDPPHCVIADVCKGLGHVERQAGDPVAARDLFRRSLAMAREYQSPIFTLRALICLAASAGDMAEWRRAARLLGAAEACKTRYALALEPIDRSVFDEATATSRAALDDPAWQAAWAEGRAMNEEDVLAFALETSDSTT